MRGSEFKPAKQRDLVEDAAAFGIFQSEIAKHLKIDEKMLRKHFRRELDNGKFKLDMIAGKTLVELMRSRDERARLEATKYLHRPAHGLERDHGAASDRRRQWPREI
jgi:hypothetical protein